MTALVLQTENSLIKSMIKKVNKYNILKKKKKLYNYFLMNNQYLIRKKTKNFANNGCTQGKCFLLTFRFKDLNSSLNI